jgi:hypothetical protein
MGASAGLTPHLNVRTSATANYSPLYQFDLFPSMGQDPLEQLALPLDYTLSVHHALYYGTSAGLSYAPTKRSTFDVSYAYRDVRTNRQSTFRGKTQDASATYHRGISKGLGVRLGYRSMLSEYGDPVTGTSNPARSNSFQVGLDYGLAQGLKLSRRTTVAFDFGAGTSYYHRATQFRLLGTAKLTQQLFRTWNLAAGYNRGLSFVDGFAAPLFSDSAMLRVGGRLTRRLRLAGTVAYSLGGVDVVSAGQRYHSQRSLLSVQGALTRRVDAFVQYFYYRHAFNAASFLIQGAPPQLSRQGIRAGLSLSMPLLSGRTARPRRPS